MQTSYISILCTYFDLTLLLPSILASAYLSSCRISHLKSYAVLVFGTKRA
jgi:hypothetical protein